MPVQRETGYLSAWIASRSYGFITVDGCAGNDKRVFVHRSAIVSGLPAPGRRVTFTKLEGDKGLFAAEVVVEGHGAWKESRA